VRYKLVLRSRSSVRAVLTTIALVGAIGLAGCTSDGTPASTGNAGSIGSFVRNLFGSKSEDEPPVAHNEAPVEPSALKTKSASSKPKHPAVAAAPAHSAKLRSQPAKTATEVPKASLKRQASAEPQSPPESATPPLLGGAAPTLPTGSFDNGVGSRR
jgi:anaerobic selenocysteine-containing dehydrogenase